MTQGDPAERIVDALDRIARGLRTHRQAVAGGLGLTPLQLDLLIAVGELPASAGPATPGVLAREVGVRQPTATEALATLEHKGRIRRGADATDRRRTVVELTDAGRAAVTEARLGRRLIEDRLREEPEGAQGASLETLLAIIGGLLDAGVLSVARTCTTCRFYERHDGGARCGLLEMPLPSTALRVDCPEHEPLQRAG